MEPDSRSVVELDGPFDVVRSLPGHGHTIDPTRAVHGSTLLFTARTPDGPATTRVRSETGALAVEAWGAGAGWMTDRSEALAARADDPRELSFDHHVLDRTNHRHPGVRHAAHGCVVDALLARILGQRVLAVEAGRSWAALCRTLGDPAPGPFELLLPPDHQRVAQTPYWWFHRYGVERARATAMVTVARHSRRLAEAVDLPLPLAYGRLRAVRGLGPWTVNGVVRTALGDPDAIVTGDFWISHAVCSFFTGRPRGSDQEMLDLVERWTGQRGRVERLVALSGHRVQRFAPGRPTPRIAQL